MYPLDDDDPSWLTVERWLCAEDEEPPPSPLARADAAADDVVVALLDLALPSDFDKVVEAFKASSISRNHRSGLHGLVRDLIRSVPLLFLSLRSLM